MISSPSKARLTARGGKMTSRVAAISAHSTVRESARISSHKRPEGPTEPNGRGAVRITAHKPASRIATEGSWSAGLAKRGAVLRPTVVSVGAVAVTSRIDIVQDDADRTDAGLRELRDHALERFPRRSPG